MPAMMLDEANRFRMTEVAMPEVQPNQALAKVTSAGICASDLATIHGYSPSAVYPFIPGHECVGEVGSAPAGSRYAVGDLVTIFPGVGCGVCKAGQEGRTSHCPTCRVIGIGLPGGRTVLAGLPHGDATLQIPYIDAYRKELADVVSRNCIKQDFLDTVAMLESGAIDAAGMVTATFSLADMPKALEGLEGSPENHLKVVLKP